MHDGEHVHEHTHDGLHHHEHTDGCGSDHAHGHHHEFTGQADTAQIKHILGYMLAHNREHASELSGMSVKLRESGRVEAADTLDEGVKLMNSANEKLALTLTHIP